MRKLFAGFVLSLVLTCSTCAFTAYTADVVEGPYLWSPSGNVIPDIDGGGGGGNDKVPDVPGGGSDRVPGVPGGGGGRSPKTGDINILLLEGIGAAAAGVAVVSRKKRHA